MKRAFIKKLFFITSLFFVFGFISEPKKIGLEIYLIELDKPILNDYPLDCYCCVDLTKITLSTDPLITDGDISFFNWKKQTIILTEIGRKKLQKIKFPKQGSQFVTTAVVLDGQPIYSMVIFPIGSSTVCDRAFVFFPIDSNTIKIHFGAGIGKNEFRFGTDPRYDVKLEKYVEERFGHN